MRVINDFEVYDVNPAIYIGYDGDNGLGYTMYSKDLLEDLLKSKTPTIRMASWLPQVMDSVESSVELKDSKSFNKFFNYKSNTPFRVALIELLEIELLYRTQVPGKYWVNAFMLNRDAAL